MTTALAPLPISQRINFRIVLFAGIVLIPLGVLTYLYLSVALTEGIRQRSDGWTEVDLMAMVSFPFDQKYGTIDDVPPKYRELDGKKVILTGEMVATTSAAPEIEAFSLVYSIAKCCYNTEPQVQHFIHSTVVNGGKVPYYAGLVNVYGTLHVDVKKSADAPKVESVFQFDVEKVEPLG